MPLQHRQIALLWQPQEQPPTAAAASAEALPLLLPLLLLLLLLLRPEILFPEIAAPAGLRSHCDSALSTSADVRCLCVRCLCMGGATSNCSLCCSPPQVQPLPPRGRRSVACAPPPVDDDAPHYPLDSLVTISFKTQTPRCRRRLRADREIYNLIRAVGHRRPTFVRKLKYPRYSRRLKYPRYPGKLSQKPVFLFLLRKKSNTAITLISSTDRPTDRHCDNTHPAAACYTPEFDKNLRSSNTNDRPRGDKLAQPVAECYRYQTLPANRWRRRVYF